MVDKIIETPMLTAAEHVSYDIDNNPIYYDGAEYWVILENGRIKYYENDG